VPDGATVPVENLNEDNVEDSPLVKKAILKLA
jgi:hypothetical protein